MYVVGHFSIELMLLVYHIFQSDTAAAILLFFFAARFCAVTIRGWRLFPWKPRRHQQRLDKAHTSNTVTTVRRCQ